MRKIKLINDNGRSVEVEVTYKSGQVMTHYMTKESYKVAMLVEDITEKYGVPENVLAELTSAVREEANRDFDDEERD